MGKQYRVVIEIEVDDARALASYAKQIAIGDNRLQPKEWAGMRRDQGKISADLQMILDPGESPAGTSILQSYVEAL